MTARNLDTDQTHWKSDASYSQSCPFITEDKFFEVTNLLLENPNLNSTHLFRADILHDSAKVLRTVEEKERACHCHTFEAISSGETSGEYEAPATLLGTAPAFKDATPERVILRRLVPRKPQLDHALQQWCYVYKLGATTPHGSGHVVVYVPDVKDESDMPWYHPSVKALAYVYEVSQGDVQLSVHYVPFSSASDILPTRLHRTFISLLHTFLRLAKSPAPSKGLIDSHETEVSIAVNFSVAPSALKDTILPQHIVQDTYSRLKQRYAHDLISRWEETTDPSKHVFEDLSIAAFLLELWKQMYSPGDFPGFVDIACGNGILTYILVNEGFHGRGFDARRRRSWESFGLNQFVDEMTCVPRPLLDQLAPSWEPATSKIRVHDGKFPPGTFVISNHADELTPWTPILAAMSNPQSPLPFLAIPCCSHALNGAKHRYTAKDSSRRSHDEGDASEEQPARGDLRAQGRAKAQAASHHDETSTYACLTRKTATLAEELGFEVELTLMRIPSTRNVGIVGNRRKGANLVPFDLSKGNLAGRLDRIQRLVEDECTSCGGIHEAAKVWVERAAKLQEGGGRGKVNLGRKPQPESC